MITLKKASVLTTMILGMTMALSVSLPSAGQAASCGADVKKAEAQWSKIQKKIDSGEYDANDKAQRAMGGLIRRAGEAGEAGKNKKCAKLLNKVRSRWEEKGWK